MDVSTSFSEGVCNVGRHSYYCILKGLVLQTQQWLDATESPTHCFVHVSVIGSSPLLTIGQRHHHCAIRTTLGSKCHSSIPTGNSELSSTYTTTLRTSYSTPIYRSISTIPRKYSSRSAYRCALTSGKAFCHRAPFFFNHFHTVAHDLENMFCIVSYQHHCSIFGVLGISSSQDASLGHFYLIDYALSAPCTF
ncbi:hypothetical protein BDQ17DRAFT_1371381 [Cyathus striatus]|nr:hypothetical protein BDQ17DRAFT_1371381 [Cyathus striatus]